MDFKKIGIAGGGVMGTQIGFQMAYCGFDVTIWVRSDESIERSKPRLERLRGIYLDTLEAMKTDETAYAYGLMAKEDVSLDACEAAKARVERAYANIKLSTSYDEAFGDADMVLETIAEDPAQKTAFYLELAKHLQPDTVICTNSSTLLPSTFMEATGRPDKYLTLHFSTNTYMRPVAEVMVTSKTDMKYMDELCDFARAIRMIPLRINKEIGGYFLNSLSVPFLLAGVGLVAQGYGTPEDVDASWTLGTGAPRGPLAMCDIIGLVTVRNVAALQPGADDPSSKMGAIVKMLTEMIDRGETGVIAGKGFYDYGK